MQKLILYGLSSKSVDVPTEEDQRLINAIVQSGLTQLKQLNLSENPSWFRHSETQGYLFDFIGEQTCLNRLDLPNNKFDGELTEKVLNTLLQTSNFKTIATIDLMQSCDFSDNKTLELLANFVDQAQQLTEFFMRQRDVERQVNVQFEPAEKGRAGSIKICDVNFKPIFQIETQRTKNAAFPF